MNGMHFTRCLGSDLLAEWYAGALVTRGVLAVLLGLLYLLYPAALPVTFGIILLFNGGIALGAAFTPGCSHFFGICYALLMLLMGVAVLSAPILWGTTFLWALGLWLAVSAVVQLIRYFRHDRSDIVRPLQLAMALISALLGAAFFCHPLFSQLLLNCAAGGGLIASGVFAVFSGIFLSHGTSSEKQ